MAQTSALRKRKGTVIDYTATADIIAGEVLVIGTTPVIAPVAITNGEVGALDTGGEWQVPKTTDVFAAGDAVYWDENGSPTGGTALSGAADNSSGTGNLMGWASEAATNNATYVSVMLHAAKRTATIGGAVTATDIVGEDSTLNISGLAGAANTVGGTAAVAAGAGGTGTSNGGAASVAGGAAGAVGGTGGALTLLSGAGDGTNGTAGAVILDSSGTGSTKGAVTIGTNAATLTLGKMPRVPMAAVTAAGGNIATAGACSEGYNLISASDNSKGVQLPSCVDGAQCVIINLVTDKTLEIYPPTGKQVNLAGANNAITVAANSVGFYVSEGTNAWYGLHATTDVA